MKEKNVILYSLRSEAQTSKSVEGWLGHTVHSMFLFKYHLQEREWTPSYGDNMTSAKGFS